VAQTKDPSWQGFGQWLVKAMEDAGVRPAQLARELNDEFRISPSTVAKWRSGVQHPRLSDLPEIARVLGFDPIDVAIQVGVLPPSYTGRVQVEMAMRLSQYQADLARLHAERVQVATRTAMADLLDSVLETKRWGLAIQPAYEGPPDDRLHLANRLAFRRTDGESARVEDVLIDFGDHLRQLHASAGKVGGWPAQSDGSDAPVRFSIPVYSRPREPRHSTALHPHCPAVLVVSTTVKSWAPVFSRHLADTLGYGLTSGLDLAASVHLKSIEQTVSKERADQSFLLIRNAPSRYVSYHYESSEARDSRTVEALSTMPNDESKVIWLREDDELLRFAVAHRSDLGARERERDLEATLRHRDAVDRIVAGNARLGRRTLQVDLRLPSGSSSESDPYTVRDERIAATIAAASDAHAELVRRGWVAPTSR
jgi:transcriptional regulator with XRE-family HTH domain